MPRPRAVTVLDLVAVASQNTEGEPFLLCPTCGERNSASPGDYFMVPGETRLMHCRRLMRLVREVHQYQEVAIPGR
jgi:hypothetical protein